jgi:hypothetical protein
LIMKFKKKMKIRKLDKDYRFTGKLNIRNINFNPVLGNNDNITDEPINNPVISETGYILNNAIWNKILFKNNQFCFCPFTKVIIQKKNLVKLTKENIDLYKNKIKNVDF